MCFSRDFISTSGLVITTKQAKKKWNNLKVKYKVSIRCLFICFVLYTDRAFQGFLHMKLTYTQYHFSGPLNRVTVIKGGRGRYSYCWHLAVVWCHGCCTPGAALHQSAPGCCSKHVYHYRWGS